jgi:hypothetical protein
MPGELFDSSEPREPADGLYECSHCHEKVPLEKVAHFMKGNRVTGEREWPVCIYCGPDKIFEDRMRVLQDELPQ